MNRPLTRTDFWAKLKTEEDGSVIDWHPLLAHSADVAAVVESLLQRTILRNRLASLVGWDTLSDVHVARLSALAALHDAGKVNHGFQNRAFGESPTSDHVTPMVGVYNASDPMAHLAPMGIAEMQNWAVDLDVLGHLLLATFGHHGEPVPPRRHDPMLWEETEARDPNQGLSMLSDHVQRWFPAAYEGDAAPFPDTPALQHAFNGLLTLADWIGSDETLFPFADGTEAPMERARARAAEAVDTLFLDARAPRAALGDESSFDQILENPDWDPYPIQEAVRDVPLHENGGLTVLESDTGSGKTEAALARYVRLFREGLVDGLYFAVPTRTAATQLHGRVTAAAKRLFAEEQRPPVVQAVPGYIKADDVEATRLPESYGVRWDEQIQHRGWAAEGSKRYLAAPIAVGTVDQVLLSTLQASHAHMRGTALLRHLLVVDEVHASDAYMTRLMDRVLGQHLAAGGHALLMSATLGASARVHLTTNENGDLPTLEEAEATDYPLVTHVGADRTDPESVYAASSGENKTVEPTLQAEADAPASVAERALHHARSGARVLVIRNLVDDCIATQRALEAQAEDRDLLFGVGGTPAPHHSRFAPDDRQRLDDAIEDTFGPDAPSRGVVAVATQTVEQSLDLDADLMITDLCPMDVLLQRIGRLQRHGRTRPEGYETAQCIVLTPETRDLSGDISSDGQAFGPHGLGTVYGDLRVIEATWETLSSEDLAPWHIPEDNRTLVERATYPSRLQAIVQENSDAWHRHEQWVLGSKQADRQATGHVTIDRSEPFGAEPFPEDLETAKTRLGQEDYRVELPEAADGPFGAAIEELSVSEWQLEEPPDTEEATDVSGGDGEFSFRFSGHSFRYDRLGLSPQSE
ncbi:MAG: CRISPR-associated helicase Cas3' [Salinibacter sp.]